MSNQNEITLRNLHNPAGIQAILVNSGALIEANEHQGWQETNGRYELWHQKKDGSVIFVKSWNKKCVISVYDYAEKNKT